MNINSTSEFCLPILRSIFLTVLAFVSSICLPLVPVQAQLPAQFVDEVVSSAIADAVGIAFDANGRMFAWSKSGRVYVFQNGLSASPTLLLDIADEVGDWRDHGMLGFALDPNFLENGYFYLHYAVDRHHLLNFGTANYSATTNTYFQATIMRVTRYQADVTSNFTSILPNSRFILIGETKETGTPLLHDSHGTGSLVFGTDGTLLVATGDGASYNSIDVGNASETYYVQALNDGILKPKENIGALRSQLIDCHNGKILRIDPMTGNGISNNPYYDASAPRAPRSRVWALGLRNPFRCTLRPGSGSTNPTVGNPGALYIGDVGWGTWEDLNVCNAAAQNFGWPLFEGLTPHTGYTAANVENKDAPNPLYNSGTCTRQFFYFKELLKQATIATPSFPNPCNTAQQITNVPTFLHARPAIDWLHGSAQARTGTYSGTTATTTNLDAAGSPVPGPSFMGSASVGGVWYTGTAFPQTYWNNYFHADYTGGWIKRFNFNNNNQPTAAAHFHNAANIPIAMAFRAADGWLYYVGYTSPNTIRRIRYTGTVNQPPDAIATATPTVGTSPLTVNFQGNNSTDPENSTLTYFWNFGNGNTSTLANPSQTFTATGPTVFNVMLRVTDNTGLKDSTYLSINLNNTAPTVSITSPSDGYLYPMTSNTILPLQASVTDAQHTDSQLIYAWQTIFLHDTHTHPEAIDYNHTTQTVISPAGCGTEYYAYKIKLTVTDPGGLAGKDSVTILPNCSSINNYCPSSSNFPWHDWIAGVQVGSINNLSGKSNYSNFTSQSTNIAQGSSIPITLTTGYSWDTYGEYWAIWIDFNKNNTFEASERALGVLVAPPSSGTPTQSSTHNLLIPTNAVVGTTRMRVSMKRGSEPAICETIPFGEVEDYSINITAGTGGGTGITIATNTTPVTCNNGNNGSATAMPSGGTPPYSYLWANGQTTQTISNLLAATYSVTVTASAGGSAVASASVMQPAAINPNGSVQNASVPNTANGSISIAPSGGTAPYSYIWTTGASTASISNLLPGNYTVTVKDINLCQNISTFTVSSSSTGPSYCSTSSSNPWEDWIAGVQLGTLNNSSGKSTYSNFTALNTSIAAGSTNNIILTSGFSWATYTEYWRVWIDYNQNGTFETNEQALSVSVPPPANGTPSVSSTYSLVVPATVTTGLTRMRVSMKRGAYPTACETIPNGEVEDYQVNLTASTGGFNVSIQSTAPSCAGGTNGSVTAIATGGTTPYTYLWNNGQTTSSINNLSAGTYTVTVTSATAATRVATTNIVAPNAIAVNIAVQNTASATANNGSATANPTGGTPPYTYLWNTSATGSTLSNLPAGNYSVTVTDFNTCTASAITSVAIQPSTLNYCSSSSNNPWVDWIAGVQIGAINNASGKSPYSNFTILSTTLNRGANYLTTLTTGFSWSTYTEFWAIWIDFNQNGTFEASEQLLNTSVAPPPNGTSQKTSTHNILIPTTAPVGATRMRISMKRGSAPSPCEIIPNGEVEDYTVNIATPKDEDNTGTHLSNFALFPNPADQVVYIDLNNYLSDKPISMSLYNLTGQIVWNKTLSFLDAPFYILDLSSFGNGLYLLTMQQEGGMLNGHKLLIER